MMFSFFKFRPTTVDAAVAPLLRAIADLETVADDCNSRAATNRAEVNRLEARIKADQTEMTRAEAVAEKIKAITSLEE